MKLYDYLKLHNEDEVTVTDTEYDTESYWYWNDKDEKDLDDFDKGVIEISKHLEIKKINSWNVVCNISDLIESRLEEIKKADLFIEGIDTYDIMEQFDAIIAGYVSPSWMLRFAKAICK